MGISRQVKQCVLGPRAKMCLVSLKSSKEARKLDSSINYS